MLDLRVEVGDVQRPESVAGPHLDSPRGDRWNALGERGRLVHALGLRCGERQRRQQSIGQEKSLPQGGQAGLV
jgi:hypothetical protein